MIRTVLKKAVFALGLKKRFDTTFLCSFRKSCLSQKLFVTLLSVVNHVKVRTRIKVDNSSISVSDACEVVVTLDNPIEGGKVTHGSDWTSRANPKSL